MTVVVFGCLNVPALVMHTVFALIFIFTVVVGFCVVVVSSVVVVSLVAAVLDSYKHCFIQVKFFCSSFLGYFV